MNMKTSKAELAELGYYEMFRQVGNTGKVDGRRLMVDGPVDMYNMLVGF